MEWLVDTAQRGQVAGVQAELVNLLRSAGADTAAVDDAAVVFAELISNVVRHAPGPAAVSLGWSAGGPQLTVEDTGPGFALLADRRVDVMAEHGRGLLIVAALAADLHVGTSRYGGARVQVRLLTGAATGAPGSSFPRSSSAGR